MSDFEQVNIQKIMNLQQGLSSAEENEEIFTNSVTSNHLTSQTAFKQEKEESHMTSQAVEDGGYLNKMASLTCQVKTEPQIEGEEDGCDKEDMAEDYPGGYVIKREIIEVHTEDKPMMDDEENRSNTTKDEDCGTEANHSVKSENDNLYPNFPDMSIDEQKSMLDPTREINKQQISGRIATRKKISRTQACHTKKSHTCSVCSKVFPGRQACLQHVWNTHTGEDPYSCEVCGKGFKYISKLQRHKAVHSDDRPFSCDVCMKTFKLKGYLYLHITTVHSEERPFSCDVCKKAFKQNIVLQRHKVFCHSTERPYYCDLCKKAFKQKLILQRHVVSCHSNERQFFCDLCKKSFKLKEYLDSHKAVHSDKRPYSCDVCKKAFKQKQILHRHKLSCHSNERPYSCDVCKKAFKQKQILHRHKLSCHSNERPYSCNLCKKTFKVKLYLNIHVATVHSDERLL